MISLCSSRGRERELWIPRKRSRKKKKRDERALLIIIRAVQQFFFLKLNFDTHPLISKNPNKTISSLELTNNDHLRS